jgi:hypothetical protein
MTLMCSKYSCQKNYFEAISFCISDCAKNVVGYTVSKCHAITESRKLKNLEFFSIFPTISRFCYNVVINLISQYTIIIQQAFKVRQRV